MSENNGKVAAQPRFDAWHTETPVPASPSMGGQALSNYVLAFALLVFGYWMTFHVVPDLRDMRQEDAKHSKRIQEAQKTQAVEAAEILLLSNQSLKAARELNTHLKGEK